MTSVFAGKRVLLAEDDGPARRILSASLRAMELDVVEVEDGGRMLVAITSHHKNGRTPLIDRDIFETSVRSALARRPGSWRVGERPTRGVR